MQDVITNTLKRIYPIPVPIPVSIPNAVVGKVKVPKTLPLAAVSSFMKYDNNHKMCKYHYIMPPVLPCPVSPVCPVLRFVLFSLT